MELLLGATGIMLAVLVVTTESTVYSILWLIGTFIVGSILLSLFHLGYASLLYIIVYIGAIAILFLFVVQLLDLSKEDKLLAQSYRKVPFLTYLTPLTGLLISWSAIFVVYRDPVAVQELLYTFTHLFTQYNVGEKLHLVHVDPVQADSFVELSLSPVCSTMSQVDMLAIWFYGSGGLSLLIISVILLLAMIAPICLCTNPIEERQV